MSYSGKFSYFKNTKCNSRLSVRFSHPSGEPGYICREISGDRRKSFRGPVFAFFSDRLTVMTVMVYMDREQSGGMAAAKQKSRTGVRRSEWDYCFLYCYPGFPQKIKAKGNYSVLKKASGGKVCHLESVFRSTLTLACRAVAPRRGLSDDTQIRAKADLSHRRLLRRWIPRVKSQRHFCENCAFIFCLSP